MSTQVVGWLYLRLARYKVEVKMGHQTSYIHVKHVTGFPATHGP